MRPYVNESELIGYKFNNITVESFLNRKDGILYYLCRCICGKTIKIKRRDILNKTYLSCGCIQPKDRYKSLKVGDTINGIEVLELLPKRSNAGDKLYKLKCYCGNIFISTTHRIKYKNTMSCGCYRKVNTWNNGYCSKFQNNRQNIRAWFNNTCAMCDIKGKSKLYKDNLLVHHILENKLSECDNSKPYYITLCRSCHSKLHFSKEKQFYTDKLLDMIINKYNGKCYFNENEWKIMKDWIYITT